MRQHITFEFDSLEEELLERMKTRGCTPVTITGYRYLCNSIFTWLKNAGFTSYSKKGGEQFLQDYLVKNGKNQYYSNLRTVVCRLNDIVQGTWEEVHSDKGKKFFLSDEYITVVDAYCKWGKDTGLASGTTRIKRYAVSWFLDGLCGLGCSSLDHLSADKVAIACSKITDHNLWGEIRIFLKYLAESRITEADYSTVVPHHSKPYVIPSVYSIDEIKLVESVIDTDTIIGKRDHAMFLLASRMGMRPGDIVRLKTTDVGNKKDRLEIIQEKTGKPLHLPVINEVRLAIDAYLKVRPDVDAEELFISACAPYHAVTTGVMRHAIRKYMTLSGVDIGNRRHGPHSLRASLASSMVNDSVPYEAVRKVLGHSSGNAIKHYARIDIEKLRQYGLVPPEPAGRFHDFLEGRCM